MKITPETPLYTIGVVEDLVEIPQRILRFYEEKGVIKPSRSVSNRRLYSQLDLDKIRYVHYLHRIKRVNLAGIREIFHLLDNLKESERTKLIAEFEEEMSTLSAEKRKLYEETSLPPEKEIGEHEKEKEIHDG